MRNPSRIRDEDYAALVKLAEQDDHSPGSINDRVAHAVRTQKTADYVVWALTALVATALSIGAYFLYDSNHAIWGTIAAVFAGLLALLVLVDALF